MDRARKEGRRLMVVSPGSMEASILGRNALNRLLANRLDGFFRRIDYVFFRTEEDRSHRPAPEIHVHDVSGREPPPVARDIPGLRKLSILVTGFARIWRIARESRPHVVTAGDPFVAGAVAFALARALRVPFVVTLVSNYRLSWRVAGMAPTSALPPSLAFALERWLLGKADLVRADCRHYAEYAVERGARRRVVRVIPRYADPIFYEETPEEEIWPRLGIDLERPPLVYVGRLSPEKYPHDLVDAFLRVRERCPDTELVVLGGTGPEREAVLSRVREAGADDALHLLEGLDRDELRAVVAEAAVLLVPHGGYALLEAALSGAPVVAYDYEWHPELIEDGVTGRLVPYRDPHAMADAAVELLRDPAEARRLGRNARDFALERFHPRRTLEASRDAYHWVLEEKG